MPTYDIVVFAGDHCGPEVIPISSLAVVSHPLIFTGFSGHC